MKISDIKMPTMGQISDVGAAFKLGQKMHSTYGGPVVAAMAIVGIIVKNTVNGGKDGGGD